MSSLVYLIPLALVLGGAALAAFFWTLRSGQYEDLDGAAERILLDEEDDHPKPDVRRPRLSPPDTPASR